MWKVVTRLLLAGWFIGMVGVAVWNGRGAAAQGGGNEQLYLPLIQKPDLVTRDYLGLVTIIDDQNYYDYYTIRGDGSGWSLLVNSTNDFLPTPLVWSPDGAFVVFSNFAVERTEVWMVSLASREAREIAPIRAEKFFWSPNSRYVTFTNADSLYVFDTQTDEIVGVWTTRAYNVFWSPDSKVLGWVADHAPTDEREALWLWQMSNEEPTVVFTGNLANEGEVGTDTGYFWSPDSGELLFNAQHFSSRTIYKTTATGESAFPLLEQSTMFGWVENGNRILINQGGWYLAQPDGTELTFFSSYAPSGYALAVSIAPTGDNVLFGSWYDPFPTVLQATDSLTATAIDGCRGYTFQWQADGARFACDSNDVLRGDFGTKVGDATTAPPTIQRLPGQINPRFIPNSTTFLAMDHYRAAYPSPFEGSV
jgi:hypothetical protein